MVHEFALRLVVGGPEVMHKQLLHPGELCTLPDVEIQVQAADAGAYPAMDSSSNLLRFANGPAGDVVQVSGTEAFYRDRAATEPYRAAWDRRGGAALDLQASRRLVLDATAQFEPRPAGHHPYQARVR